MWAESIVVSQVTWLLILLIYCCLAWQRGHTIYYPASQIIWDSILLLTLPSFRSPTWKLSYSELTFIHNLCIASSFLLLLFKSLLFSLKAFKVICHLTSTPQQQQSSSVDTKNHSQRRFPARCRCKTDFFMCNV